MDNKDFEILGENEVKANDHIDFFDDFQDVTRPQNEDIFIKTASKLVGEPFEAKDGNTYCKVKIPNRDENDKSPWASFVVPADKVMDDKFSENCKCFPLSADGTTTVTKDFLVGKDEEGKGIYDHRKKTFKNTDLKKIVEAYKDRERTAETPSFQEQLQEAKKEASEKAEKAFEKPAKSKSKDKAI